MAPMLLAPQIGLAKSVFLVHSPYTHHTCVIFNREYGGLGLTQTEHKRVWRSLPTGGWARAQGAGGSQGDQWPAHQPRRRAGEEAAGGSAAGAAAPSPVPKRAEGLTAKPRSLTASGGRCCRVAPALPLPKCLIIRSPSIHSGVPYLLHLAPTCRWHGAG